MYELVFFKYLQPEPKCHWISAVGEGNILRLVPFLELYYTCFHQYNQAAMKNKQTNQPPAKKLAVLCRQMRKKRTIKIQLLESCEPGGTYWGKEQTQQLHVVKAPIAVILHFNLFFKCLF